MREAEQPSLFNFLNHDYAADFLFSFKIIKRMLRFVSYAEYMNTIINIIKAVGTAWSKLSLGKKLIIIVIILACMGGLFFASKAGTQQNATQYETGKVTKGTLVVSVSATGTISAANSAEVSTQTSGVVSKIYVKNGDAVKAGDRIADVTLDMNGQQRSAQAYASYLSAKNNLQSAQDTYYSLQAQLFTQWKSFTDLATNSTYTNGDGSPNTENRQLAAFIESNDNWLSAQSKYNEQQGVVSQAQVSLNSAWSTYQETSPTIYAPIAGTINGLALRIGSVLTAQTSSTGTSTSQSIANILTDSSPTAEVGINELDVPNINIGNKVTMTLDAFPNKTFTGKVVSVNTTGTISSGVTTYPAYIAFDDTTLNRIYPNMAVDATIITIVKNNVFLVSNDAVQTANGTSTVQVLKNGKPTTVTVTVGDSNDSETEIVTGLNVGDTVVTGTTSTTAGTASSTKQSTSIFGGTGRTGSGPPGGF